MRILPYLSPWCGVLAARFSNLTKFECSHKRDAVTYTHDNFHNKCKRPRHATRKFQTYTLKINTIIWHCKKNSDYFWTRVYIIHQNNPVSKSLRCIITWFLPSRSYRCRAPRYRRHASSYRRHPIKLPSSVISDNFASRRIAANLWWIIVQKRENVRVCRFGARCTLPPARCTMPPCFSVVNSGEIGGRKEARAGKNSLRERPPSWRR